MQITQAELLKCKRAVVVMSEIAKVSFMTFDQVEPLEMKQDRLVLIEVLRRLEALAK